MAKLTKTEQDLYGGVGIDDVLAPLTDLVDALANLESAEDPDEVGEYREDAQTMAMDVLKGWPQLQSLLLEFTNTEIVTMTVEESFLDGFNEGRNQ